MSVATNKVVIAELFITELNHYTWMISLVDKFGNSVINILVNLARSEERRVGKECRL